VLLQVLLQDTRINDHYSVACGLPKVVDLTTAIAEQSSAKQKANTQKAAHDEKKRPNHGPISGEHAEETYWHSPEAKKLFLGNHANDSRGVLIDFLEEQVKQLQQANWTIDGGKMF
jgi:hypothetical protein